MTAHSAVRLETAEATAEPVADPCAKRPLIQERESGGKGWVQVENQPGWWRFDKDVWHRAGQMEAYSAAHFGQPKPQNVVLGANYPTFAEQNWEGLHRWQNPPAWPWPKPEPLKA